MAEDLDDHWRIFNGADDLQGAAAGGAAFDVEDPLSNRARLTRGISP
jgi:hypothetical protein